MSTKENLEKALKDAMRANETMRKNTLRLVLTSIKETEVAKQEDLDESTVLALVQKEVKSRHESIEDAEKAGRDDLIADANAEIAILEEFLPEQLDDEELEKLVEEAIAESGASSPAEMGKVMGIVLPKVEGRADGGRVSQVVRSKLQGA